MCIVLCGSKRDKFCRGLTSGPELVYVAASVSGCHGNAACGSGGSVVSGQHQRPALVSKDLIALGSLLVSKCVPMLAGASIYFRCRHLASVRRVNV